MTEYNDNQNVTEIPVCNILGINVAAINMEWLLKYLKKNIASLKGRYICVSNVHTTVTAYENPEYKFIQNNSLFVLPDGKPLSIIGKKRGFKNMDRITGPDFMENILSISEKKGWTHYFYGNTNENLDVLINYLSSTYPKLIIKGFAPSKFRPLTKSEENRFINQINSLNPDFVWVGIGAPKQEILCSKLADATNSIWVGVGGAFNVIAGIIPRAPQWMQNLCLEWLYRLLKEPRRLFKRYFITNIKFLFYLFTNKEIKT